MELFHIRYLQAYLKVIGNYTCHLLFGTHKKTL
ncbi:uncharacterized protein YBL071C-B [Saccharomyces cerevisiae S288C]|uniref:Uncharacterized protein YBL071C-B n=1 Tax=Saccharomyces cerevisiae (strain ATCC 204508 / S288c) TaxID=559292 RepID=YB071_YEAST|nr:uncharacterized protein YBL071C-B [Saccharomyces cerevisiae S288C]Q8TGU8.1 RecName: Full=Uncharacterized protein YBL071C-B [Saccharomyces cerevisiae S288C]AAL79200.1 unknown [Saccharomyces cerevisiae]AJQ01867.1 hypothetical protein H754_YJM320B00037 [Saccharomyces cerevisiae YJM320]AJQ02255.1 hypothetical protein H755_YJM326B00037 [Saccharomyces cerevisiae YJM326]AJQ04902.1 hypothetical protein H762_YJM541B00037 [Saccharomyces cerevisiae YJM541]AJQ05288.1 hypothetical protein H763_YJM554B0|eukprot:NP_878044.1 hypothetical protein YBL071C-B [Saccharomyces cerevisiae S288C]